MKGSSDIHRVLIVKPSSLGDIVHSLPVLHALKAAHPEAEVHWVVARGLEGLLEGHPLIHKLWVIDKDAWKRPAHAFSTIAELCRLRTRLRRERFDLTIDLQGLLRSALITRISGATERVGFANAREGAPMFYTRKVTPPAAAIHAVDRYMLVARSLGLPSDEVRFPMVSQPYPLDLTDYAVIVPGARWASKVWPADRFGTVAASLPLPSVIVGSGADTHKARVIVERSGGKAIDLTGKTTLGQLSHVISRARLMVTNDSGPMHIAAAWGVPVVAIFGPTSPGLTGPYGTGHTVIRAEDIECAPCRNRECESMKCMAGVQPERVINAANACL